MWRGDTRRWRHGKLLGNQNAKRDGMGRCWGSPGLGKMWRRALHKALRNAERLNERLLENRAPQEVLEIEELDEDVRATNKAARVESIVNWKDS